MSRPFDLDLLARNMKERDAYLNEVVEAVLEKMDFSKCRYNEPPRLKEGAI